MGSVVKLSTYCHEIGFKISLIKKNSNTIMEDSVAKKATAKSCSLRKTKKPLIEKRRRDRINKSLSQLRTLLLDNMKRTGAAQTSRMDKADILELTVSYLKLLNFEESETARATQRQYKAGYTSCARVALKFIQESTTVNQIVKTNMEEFLTNQSCEPTQTNSSEYNRRLNGLNSAGSYTCNQVTQEPIHIQIPTSSFSKSAPPFSTRTKINTLMLADQCAHLHKDTVQSRPYATSVNELSCALNIFGEIGTDTTHPLNLSAASDSSLNGGDVWRPW